jgi:hypothetical protein
MTILIANAHKDIVKGYFKRAKFISNTQNTSTFNTTNETYLKVLPQIRKDGYNQFSLLCILN